MKRRMAVGFLAAAVAGGLLAGGQAAAQELLSEDEVRSFFDDMGRTAVEAVRSKDHDALLEWTRKSVADGATISFTAEFLAGGERKALLVGTFDKDDMVRLGRVALGMLSGGSGGGIENYDLDIQVSGVEPLGPNAATVTAVYTETATFTAPGAPAAAEAKTSAQAGSSGTGAAQAGASAIEMKATAECRHVVRRAAAAEPLALGLTTCEARVGM